MTSRRNFLAGAATGLAIANLPQIVTAAAHVKPLTMPPLLDTIATGRFSLTAQAGQTNFLGRSTSETWGFNQSYLGPTIRVAHDAPVQAEIQNTLNEEISVHWHGMLIPGEVDGGPHQTIAPDDIWTPELELNQPAATLWYHSHIHGRTSYHVQQGLAGVMQVTDGLDDARGLPSDYGIDDLILVLQDRRFDRRGRADYDPGMQDRMVGFLGDTMLINGQEGATAIVPKGIVRLRLLNGSNARIYTLAMSDGRPMHLVASDGGLLDKPIPLNNLALSPGERYEVLVDFSDGADVALTSGQNINAGMMGGGGIRDLTPTARTFEILPFTVDAGQPARITKLPEDLGGEVPDLPAEQANRRSLSLDMGMGPMMMLRRDGNQFSINGDSFDMTRMDFAVQKGVVERWTVSADTMIHPFHVHGVAFQVLSENGQPPRAQNSGWKDTVLINGEADLLMRFDHVASQQNPYMLHCHILEHEDGGMMGQFTVT